MDSNLTEGLDLSSLLQNELFDRLRIEALLNNGYKRLAWLEPNYDCVKHIEQSDDPREQALIYYRALTPVGRKKAVNTQFWNWIRGVQRITIDPITGETL